MTDEVKVTTRIATRVKKLHTVELTGEHIVQLLRKAGIEVSDNAKVTAFVPGGGDWSNQELSIGDESNVTISWETNEPEEVEEVET